MSQTMNVPPSFSAPASISTQLVAPPNETMREILAISRYDMIFKVADTIEDALAG